jgi:hypothetical protein
MDVADKTVATSLRDGWLCRGQAKRCEPKKKTPAQGRGASLLAVTLQGPAQGGKAGDGKPSVIKFIKI